MKGTTRDALEKLARPIRGLALVRWVGFGLGGLALAFGMLAWLARLGWVEGPIWVLFAWALGAVVVCGALWAGWRELTRLSLHWLAASLERLGEWRAGALATLLSPPAAGTSEALLAAADLSSRDTLRVRGPDLIQSLATGFRRRTAQGLLLAAAGVVTLASARPLDGPASALWHPGLAWEAAVAPLDITASAGEVDRGATVKLRLKALGRRQATLWLRGPGEAWQPQVIRLDSAGFSIETVGPLRTDLFARLTSGDRGSDTVHVRVRLPAFLGSITVMARYPRYLSLDDEPMPVDGDTLLLPAGTVLESKGTVTAELAAARWTSAGGEVPLRVSGSGFTGSFTPSGSGTYVLDLRTRSGVALAGDGVRLPIHVMPDSAPEVAVLVPGVDTMAPLSLKVPLVIEARDDHGLRQVEVVSHRVSRLGIIDPAVREDVALPGGAPDRAFLPHELDLNQRGLLPGDTLRYFVEAHDNAPGGNIGRSREYMLKLPTLADLRAATREAARDIGGRLDSAAAEGRRLERQTEDLSREQQRQESTVGRGRSDEPKLSFEAAQRAEAVARRQDELVRAAEALKEALDQLQQSAEAAGVNDPAWQERLREIRDQLDRALSPELKERLAELRRALADLDPERAREALQQLADAQKELREALERSRELFRRAAVEGDLANMAAESRNLSQEQQQWAEQAERADSSAAQREEQDLSGRADSLAAGLDRLAPQVNEEGKSEKMEALANQVRQASEQMNQANQAMRSGDRRRARQKGQQAAQTLSPVGDQLDQERREMQEAWRQEVVGQLDQALAETARLAERQLDVSQRFRHGDATAGTRGEQGALEEGAQRLLDQIRDAAGRNAMVSQNIPVALSVALEEMRQAREAVSNAAPNTRDAAEAAEQAVDALNAAAYQMVRSRGDVQGASSGSGMQEAVEAMQRMAQQQGGLNRQAGGLLPMAGASGVQEQLRQLGARQRRLAEELERLRAKSQSPGVGEMADEARDLARRLEAGRLDRETVERQERLFRRMLDAGRTLQGQQEDENKERQSTTANEDSVWLPPALRLRLGGDGSGIRMPDWEALQRLSPEERRLVVEYFQRLSEGRP